MIHRFSFFVKGKEKLIFIQLLLYIIFHRRYLYHLVHRQSRPFRYNRQECHQLKAFRDLVGSAPETLDTIHEIADALKGNANIVNVLTEQITAGDAATLASAKNYTDAKVTDALNTAAEDATTKANDAKQGAVTEAKNYTDTKVTDAETNATNYTNTKLADYYTKAEVDASQAAQDTRIAALEAAPTGTGAGTVYDFSRTKAVKTGDKIKLANGTVKDIKTTCFFEPNIAGNTNVFKKLPSDFSGVFDISGTIKTNDYEMSILEAFTIKIYANKFITLVHKLTDTAILEMKLIVSFY